MNNVEFADRLASMWKTSREASGKSQDYVAKALGVSKRTVQNWESGYASPTFRMGLEWFDVIGLPMYPYVMNLLYPKEMEGLSSSSDIKDIRSVLNKYINELDDYHIRQLLFLFYGSHGSSPTGSLDALTAYLHLPLTMRILITDNVLSHFHMAKALGLLKDHDHVLPKVETLEKCLNSAKTAVENGKYSYTIIEEVSPT